jgi:hypothetical protein
VRLMFRSRGMTLLIGRGTLVGTKTNQPLTRSDRAVLRRNPRWEAWSGKVRRMIWGRETSQERIRSEECAVVHNI